MQEDILAVIKQHPGILQCDLKNHVNLNPDTIYMQIHSLESWGKIRRKKARDSGSFRLYPNNITSRDCIHWIRGGKVWSCELNKRCQITKSGTGCTTFELITSNTGEDKVNTNVFNPNTPEYQAFRKSLSKNEVEAIPQ